MGIFDHHAHLIVGQYESVFPKLKEALADAIIFDFIEMIRPSLGIDDARLIFEQTRTRVSPEGCRVVVVSSTQATVEAQNALLKLTEEPGERTHYFFIVPTKDVLLPTLRSRLQELAFDTGDNQHSTDVGAFMKGGFTQRQEILAPIIEEKQHDRALALCNGIEATLAEQGIQHVEALRALELARTYLLRRGSSLKLILEFVALSVPKL